MLRNWGLCLAKSQITLACKSGWLAGFHMKIRVHCVGATGIMIKWECLSQPQMTGLRYTLKSRLPRKQRPFRTESGTFRIIMGSYLTTCGPFPWTRAAQPIVANDCTFHFPTDLSSFLFLLIFLVKWYRFGGVCMSRRHVLYHAENYGCKASLNYTPRVFSCKSLWIWCFLAFATGDHTAQLSVSVAAFYNGGNVRIYWGLYIQRQKHATLRSY